MVGLVSISATALPNWTIVQEEDFNSPFRVYVAVPTEAADSHRRGRIEELLKQHVGKREVVQDNELGEVQYAMVDSSSDYFTKNFGAHDRDEDPLPYPGLRLFNMENGEYMQPDWQILLNDFHTEVDRLVLNFEVVASQTSDILEDTEDGVSILHSKNMEVALLTTKSLLTNFYAPWCQHSQAMAPIIAKANENIKSMQESKLLTGLGIGIGKVDVDIERGLLQRHDIKQYPTLKFMDKDGSSRAYDGADTNAAQIVSHLVTKATGVADIKDDESVDAFVDRVKKVDGLFLDEEESGERSVVVLLVAGGETFDAKLDAAKKHMGRNVFVAVAQNGALAGSVLSKFGAKPSSDVTLAAGGLFIVTNSGSTVTAQSPPFEQITTPDQLFSWVFSASYPAVDRFDPTRASGQGWRIRAGPVKDVMILVGDEASKEFEGLKSSLTVVSEKKRADAVYLFADKSEERLAGILGNAFEGEVTYPCVVLFNLDNDYAAQTLVGAEEITSAGKIEGLFNGAKVDKQNKTGWGEL
ncbi:hypothetical protein TL16_g01331 [Triparma laevis f. inornata]|uniref:Thioredoxin domain-containing protein n=1 Tax=Triparma laevis f. inornata TaxID=1714386 RepID=A0A9W7DSQ6_9STRA|nr:hypothetical protein TL16_g01331 [Triparma laevis f. inornata]